MPVLKGIRDITIRLPDTFGSPTIHRVLDFIYNRDYDDCHDMTSVAERVDVDTLTGSMQPLMICEVASTVGSETVGTNAETESAAETTASTARWLTGSTAGTSEVEMYNAAGRVENNINVARYADALEVQNLVETALEKIQRDLDMAMQLTEFPKVIAFGYANSPEIVRKSIEDFCAENVQQLLQEDSFANVLREIPELAAAVLSLTLGARENLQAERDAEILALKEELKSATRAREKLAEAQGVLEGRLREQIRTQADENTGLKLKCSELNTKLFEKDLKQKGELRAAKESIEKEMQNKIQVTIENAQAKLGSDHAKMQQKIDAAQEALLAENAARGNDQAQMQSKLDIVEAALATERHLRGNDQRTAALALGKEKAERRTERAQLQTQIDGANTELALQKEKFQAFIDEPSNWDHCRHCGDDLNGYFQAEGWNRYSWRCSSCRTRHGSLDRDYA